MFRSPFREEAPSLLAVLARNDGYPHSDLSRRDVDTMSVYYSDRKAARSIPRTASPLSPQNPSRRNRKLVLKSSGSLHPFKDGANFDADSHTSTSYSPGTQEARRHLDVGEQALSALPHTLSIEANGVDFILASTQLPHTLRTATNISSIGGTTYPARLIESQYNGERKDSSTVTIHEGTVLPRESEEYEQNITEAHKQAAPTHKSSLTMYSADKKSVLVSLKRKPSAGTFMHPRRSLNALPVSHEAVRMRDIQSRESLRQIIDATVDRVRDCVRTGEKAEECADHLSSGNICGSLDKDAEVMPHFSIYGTSPSRGKRNCIQSRLSSRRPLSPMRLPINSPSHSSFEADFLVVNPVSHVSAGSSSRGSSMDNRSIQTADRRLCWSPHGHSGSLDLQSPRHYESKGLSLRANQEVAASFMPSATHQQFAQSERNAATIAAGQQHDHVTLFPAGSDDISPSKGQTSLQEMPYSGVVAQPFFPILKQKHTLAVTVASQRNKHDGKPLCQFRFAGPGELTSFSPRSASPTTLIHDNNDAADLLMVVSKLATRPRHPAQSESIDDTTKRSIPDRTKGIRCSIQYAKEQENVFPGFPVLNVTLPHGKDGNNPSNSSDCTGGDMVPTPIVSACVYKHSAILTGCDLAMQATENERTNYPRRHATYSSVVAHLPTRVSVQLHDIEIESCSDELSDEHAKQPTDNELVIQVARTVKGPPAWKVSGMPNRTRSPSGKRYVTDTQMKHSLTSDPVSYAETGDNRVECINDFLSVSYV